MSLYRMFWIYTSEIYKQRAMNEWKSKKLRESTHIYKYIYTFIFKYVFYIFLYAFQMNREFIQGVLNLHVRDLQATSNERMKK